MKKVALYARVSSDIQRQERTIESQLFELRKQIAAAGHVLVKEYLDDGHSGADLDRPALEQLRKDLKTPQFHAVYFHSADRIARDVMHQHIIIAELRKYEKQIIIDGRDYANNPENTFTLTVMGAVAQFERAKIIERTTRGKQHRLRQGCLLGYGHNMYGFTYVKKTPTSPAAYVINEREAAIVRYIFETYAKGDVGIIQITRHLESTGVPTREGRRLWHVPQVKYLLKNESYAGIRYFNTERYVKATRTTKYGVTYSYEKRVPRDRSEWIGIKIPAIIPKELFDRVQARIAFNRTSYRNAKRTHLLSQLVECGVCGSRCYCYQRYCTKKAMDGSIRVRHKVAYKCNWQASHKMHTDERAERCHNPEVSAAVLEPFVFSLIRDIMLDPSRIRSCMGLFAKARTSELRIERQIDDIASRLRAIEREKKRIVDIYASGDLSREAYVAKNLAYDAEAAKLRMQVAELNGRIPLLRKRSVVQASIAAFCEGAEARLNTCTDFDSKRQFLLEYIDKIVYRTGTVSLHGSVPIKFALHEHPAADTPRIEFCIERALERAEPRARVYRHHVHRTRRAARGHIDAAGEKTKLRPQPWSHVARNTMLRSAR